jgi:cyclase
MLRPRLIPCLLLRNNGLVKTVRFGDHKYVGDPINAVRIFNEKIVDELMVLDIDSTRQGREPNYELIRKIANECRMPLTYGGGVNTASQIERIIGLGIEKVAISAAAIANPSLIEQAAERVGSQSIVVVLDVARVGLRQRYEIFTHNATKRTRVNPFDFAREVEMRGAGEIVVNSIDRDGTMGGFDYVLAERLRAVTNLPLTMLGGASSLADVAKLWASQGIIGAAVGSLFVFKGKYRAVLINYPNDAEKRDLLKLAGCVQ